MGAPAWRALRSEADANATDDLARGNILIGNRADTEVVGIFGQDRSFVRQIFNIELDVIFAVRHLKHDVHVELVKGGHAVFRCVVNAEEIWAYVNIASRP